MKKHFVRFTVVVLCSAAMSSCVKLATATGPNTGEGNQSSGQYPNEPGESTSKAFMGLKEITDEWGNYLFGNPECDKNGRLTYSKCYYYNILMYMYNGNTIVCSQSDSDDLSELHSKITYILDNGLITSFSEKHYDYDPPLLDEYNVKYDKNRRIVQIISDDGQGNSMYSKNIYNFKWDSSGDIYEVDLYYGDDEKLSYVTYFDYYTAAAYLPPMILGGNELWYAYELSVDPLLVMSEYYGKSMPNHALKSLYRKMIGAKTEYPYERYSWSYDFDSEGRITSISQKYEDLYNNGKNDETKTYTVKWE